jgi:UDP-3-O-[3-hydroxymyristoyl] N-acetylglucosamine deacetylase
MDGMQHAPRPTEPASFVGVAQSTLKASIDCVGIGLHSGRRVRMVLRPAAPNHGLVFRRADLGRDIPARFDLVADTRLATVLADPADTSVRLGTIEHVMAALSGCGIDNALIEVDGPELPALDGSAAHLVFLIDCAGIAELAAARPVIEVLKRVTVRDGDASAVLEPLPSGRSWHGLDITMSIDFAAAAIGRQDCSFRLSESAFRAQVAEARTFALSEEIDELRAAGLARGGNLGNAVVVEGERVLNPAGLRMPDEFVRHKVVDAVGDLALAGGTLFGRFTGHRSGHRLNNLVLRALFADRRAWRMITAGAMSARGISVPASSSLSMGSLAA